MSQVRDQLEQELEELTASLFEVRKKLTASIFVVRFLKLIECVCMKMHDKQENDCLS